MNYNPLTEWIKYQDDVLKGIAVRDEEYEDMMWKKGYSVSQQYLKYLLSLASLEIVEEETKWNM